MTLFILKISRAKVFWFCPYCRYHRSLASQPFDGPKHEASKGGNWEVMVDVFKPQLLQILYCNSGKIISFITVHNGFAFI